VTAAAWRREPFRLFFPLGAVLGWAGIGHWIAYAAGWASTYSCLAHGVAQVQGFLLAFALGFLLTAIPRRTESAPAPAAGIVLAGLALVTTTAAALHEEWWIAEGASIALVAGLVAFAVPRFRAGGRRPPAAFVLLPMGLGCNVAGAVLLAWSPTATTIELGRLLVEQGLFLCLVMGAGALVLPIMAGATPPPDLGSSPAVTRSALAYGAAGLAIVASLAAEAADSVRIAPVVRGLVVAATLVAGAGIARPVARPGWNRRLARLACWLVPAGIVLSGAFPDFRVPALHVTFVGGFGLLAFTVATHVTAAHLELPALRDGRSPIVAVVAGGVLAAMVGRVLADITDTYFEHLAWAGIYWIAGTGAWTVALAPWWLGRRTRNEEERS
jgi:uncharacterized protein involved in response to NO